MLVARDVIDARRGWFTPAYSDLQVLFAWALPVQWAWRQVRAHIQKAPRPYFAFRQYIQRLRDKQPVGGDYTRTLHRRTSVRLLKFRKGVYISAFDDAKQFNVNCPAFNYSAI